MYDPDRMPDPICGDPVIDHEDEQIPWMNYAVWAENINNPQARILKARYYDEISYIERVRLNRAGCMVFAFLIAH
jgi:choline-sulfatase